MQNSPSDRAVAGRIEGALTRLAEIVGAVALVVLMLVVTVDVVGRGVFNAPLPWGTELLEVILAAMIFASYPLVALRTEHITVDLINVRPSVQRAQRVTGAVLGAVLYAVITWCLVRQTIRAIGYGEGTPLLSIPLSIILGSMAMLSLLTLFAFLLSAVRAVNGKLAPRSVEREIEALT